MPVGSAKGMSAISVPLLYLERGENVCSVGRVGKNGSVVLDGCIRRICERLRKLWRGLDRVLAK